MTSTYFITGVGIEMFSVSLCYNDSLPRYQHSGDIFLLADSFPSVILSSPYMMLSFLLFKIYGFPFSVPMTFTYNFSIICKSPVTACSWWGFKCFELEQLQGSSIISDITSVYLIYCIVIVKVFIHAGIGKTYTLDGISFFCRLSDKKSINSFSSKMKG